MLAAAAYYRVSSYEQTEKQTIETQRTIVEPFAALHGLTIAAIYSDDGVSGTIALAIARRVAACLREPVRVCSTGNRVSGRPLREGHRRWVSGGQGTRALGVSVGRRRRQSTPAAQPGGSC